MITSSIYVFYMDYELMVIIKPLLPEDIKSKVLKKLENFVQKASGKILKTDIWGKRHLAYKIKSYDEGYYVVLDLEIEPEKIKEFENNLKLQSDIIRFLLIRKENI